MISSKTLIFTTLGAVSAGMVSKASDANNAMVTAFAFPLVMFASFFLGLVSLPVLIVSALMAIILAQNKDSFESAATEVEIHNNFRD